jgi:hypothetical protein
VKKGLSEMLCRRVTKKCGGRGREQGRCIGERAVADSNASECSYPEMIDFILQKYPSFFQYINEER